MEAVIEYLESVKFIHLMMSPTIIWNALPLLFQGFIASLALLIGGYLLSLPTGLAAAFMKMAKNPIFRWPATFYIDFIRGTPLIVQILIIYFGVPLLVPGWREFQQSWFGQIKVFGVVDMNQYVRAVLALVIFGLEGLLIQNLAWKLVVYMVSAVPILGIAWLTSKKV